MARKKRQRRKREDAGATVEMTPMIDVVFQLLIYFVVTITPVDVSARLDVFRPSASAPPEDVVTPPRMIQIQIFREGIVINDRPVSVQRLGDVLARLGDLSATQTVMILCARDSDHEKLITVLDLCSRAGLTNLSVASMN